MIPPILVCLEANTQISLSIEPMIMGWVTYLSKKIELSIYLVRNVFKGVEAWYPNIERLTLAVAITTRKLMPYFEGNCIMVKTKCPIKF